MLSGRMDAAGLQMTQVGHAIGVVTTTIQLIALVAAIAWIIWLEASGGIIADSAHAAKLSSILVF